MAARRLLPIAFAVSLAANAALAAVVLFLVVDAAHYQSDQSAAYRAMTVERAQLTGLRAHFCPGQPAPGRAEVAAWALATEPTAEPYEKDGLLWVRDLGVRFDDAGLEGVCLYLTWQNLDRPAGPALDAAGQFCPLEPLC